MPKVNKKFSYSKCSQCRKDKQKCLPVSRLWPDRCDRCKKYCYTCSPNTATTQSRNTTFESTRERLPPGSASGSDPSGELVPLEFLSELTEEGTPQGTFHFAVKRRAIKLIQWLLAHGVDVNCRVEGRTALHAAIRCNFDDVIQLLLSERADVSAVDFYGMNSLHLAAGRGQVMTAKLLLQGSSGVGKPARERTASLAAYDDNEFTPLHHAVLIQNEDIIRLLLAAGADVNSGDGERYTPLYIAVDRRSPLNIIQCLLEHKARVSAMNHDEETALHIATSKETIDLLLKYVNDRSTLDMQDFDGHTALHRAIIHNFDDEIVASLLDAGACISLKTALNETPLHNAAKSGCEKTMRLLLKNVKQTSDLNIQDCRGRTALHTALKGYEDTAVVSIVTQLLEAGASVSVKDNEQRTPLHEAVLQDSVNCTRMLLGHVKPASELDIQDSYGSTALHLAVMYPSTATIKLVALLLHAGASVAVTTCYNETPLHVAVRTGSVTSLALLLNHVKQPSDLNIRNFDGLTALHLAIRNAIRSKFLSAVEMLLESGADLNTRSNDNTSALELALKSEEYGIKKLAEDFVAANQRGTGTGPLFSPERFHTRPMRESPSYSDLSTTGQPSITPSDIILPSYGELVFDAAPEFRRLQEATNPFPFDL